MSQGTWLVPTSVPEAALGQHAFDQADGGTVLITVAQEVATVVLTVFAPAQAQTGALDFRRHGNPLFEEL